jgi:hypothetical protein
MLQSFGCQSSDSGIGCLVLSVLSYCLGARVADSFGTRPQGWCVVSCCIGFQPVALLTGHSLLFNEKAEFLLKNSNYYMVAN